MVQREQLMQFMQFQGPNFTLEVPTDWLIQSSAQVQAMFLGPDVPPFRPNLLITVRALEPGVTVEEVAANALATQQSEYPAFQVVDEFNFAETGGSGIMRRYTWHNPERAVSVLQTQALFVHQQVLFTLTASRALDLTGDVAETLDAAFDHMLESFRIKL